MSFVTTKGIYGLCAMYELSNGDGVTPMQAKNISSKTGISHIYLEQILNQLRRATLIKSVRGAKGGYILAKSADQILIYDILIALEGEIVFAKHSLENRVLEIFFKDIEQKIIKLLNVYLSELKKYENILFDNFNYTI